MGAGGTTTLGVQGSLEGDSHLSALEGDDHLVVGDEGRLGTVKSDPHALLGACWGGIGVSGAQQPAPGPKPPLQPCLTHTHAEGRRWCLR